MSEVTKVSLSSLLSKLLPVVDWEVLGLHLNIPKHELEKIRRQFFHEGVERCKAEMLDLWLKTSNEEALHWNVISDALTKMRGLEELAQQIRTMGPSQEERKDRVDSMASKSTQQAASVNLSVKVQKPCLKRFSQLESKFAKLVSDILQELKSHGVSVNELHSYVKIRLELKSSSSPQSLDELLLDRLKPYYCLTNLTLIDNIICEFLDGSKIQQNLDEYEKQLESFKTSAKMEELVDHMTSSLEGEGEEGTVSVVLKLEGSWLGVTLKHFQQLVEEIFLERSCCFNHIQVKRGCICVSMIVPEAMTSSLVSLAKQRIEFISSIGIIRLAIGGNEIMNKEEEKDEASFSQYLMRGVLQEKIDVVRFILSLDGLGLADTISPCIEEAVESGNIQILSMLLESGSNPNFIGNKGLTPLQTASKQGHVPIVNKLLQYKADPNQGGIDGATALMLASNLNHLDIVEQLLSSGASVNKAMFDGWTALMFACDQNHLQITKRLLQSGANPNVLTHSSKCSPVYFASSKNNDPSMLAALIETGADINTATEAGVTPLIIAAQFGFEAIVSVLLNHKALLDCQTHHGFTALMAAAHKGHVDIAESLLLAGANTHITDNNGRTALEWSLQSEQHQITQLLLMNVGAVTNESEHAYNDAEYHYGGKRISEDVSSPILHPSIIKLREAMREPPLPEDTGQKHSRAIRWNNEHLIKK